MSRSKTPRDRAAACAAVARSTTHAGERQAAIGRCLAICERHGIDADEFGLPGRAQRRVESVTDWASRPRRLNEPSLIEALAKLDLAIRRRREEVGALPGESIEEAMRRNLIVAELAARERDRVREERRRDG